MACPKETSGHCFADHWGGNHGRLAHLISHTHLSSLTTNLILTNLFILVPTPHPFAFERFVVFHRRNSWLLSRPNLFVSIREIRGFNNYFDTTFSVISVVSVRPNPDEHPCYPR